MSDLSTKQRAATAALLEGQTQQGAATAAGVTKRQVQRWLIQPDFAAELHTHHTLHRDDTKRHDE